MPLQYNAFTNCKSELKYFEAAVVGTQTIASPMFTYARAIRHGENGYLAQAHQWADRIWTRSATWPASTRWRDAATITPTTSMRGSISSSGSLPRSGSRELWRDRPPDCATAVTALRVGLCVALVALEWCWLS